MWLNFVNKIVPIYFSDTGTGRLRNQEEIWYIILKYVNSNKVFFSLHIVSYSTSAIGSL